MVFTHNITNHICRFSVGLIVLIPLFAHGEKHTPVYRLQTVPDIRKGTSYNHAHGVFHVGVTHFVDNVRFKY